MQILISLISLYLELEILGILVFNSTTGKSLWKFQREKEINFCKFNSNGKQIASEINHKSISVSDSIRGHAIKVLEYPGSGRYLSSDSLKFEEDLLLYMIDGYIYILDTNNTKTVIKIKTDIKIPSTMFSLHPGGRLIAVKQNYNIISFKNLYHSSILSQHKKNMKCKGLNLEGTVVDLSAGLSEENVTLFVEKGEYYPFDKNTIRELFSNSPTNTTSNVEINLMNVSLTPLHVKIVENYPQLNNLKRLNFAHNNLCDEGGEIVGNNKTWVNLEELILKKTNIGDKSAIAISRNQTWKNLKKLDLSQNNIGDEGAVSISESDVWKNLAALNLSSNKHSY